ncbi:hypothetical protein J6590_035030 [Homalodisca vitripennis]|nr:hypothetical protein J6590_035030 [Homalodisca vitripennis]
MHLRCVEREICAEYRRPARAAKSVQRRYSRAGPRLSGPSEYARANLMSSASSQATIFRSKDVQHSQGIGNSDKTSAMAINCPT